jgi:peptidoglycan/LPS O-acetylase OafA/YrhL
MAEVAHFKLLDGVRGLAAQPVLFSHSFALIFVGVQGPAVTAIGWFARLAVIVFFVLSGFVICAGIAGEIGKTSKFNWFEFTIRRVARIYPPYLAAIGFVAAVAVSLGVAGRHLNVDTWAWLRALSFTFVSNDAVTITPVWSLRLEVGLYVFAAMTTLAFLATGRLRVILCAVTLALFAAYCWRLAFGGLAAALFATGGLAAIFFDRLVKIRSVWILAGVVFAFALPMAWPSLVDDTAKSILYQGILGIPIALGLVALAHVKVQGQSQIGSLILASGGWSYTLYIIHIPVVIALTTLIPVGPEFYPRFAMLMFCLVTTNLVAVVVALAVERPKLFARLIRLALMREEISPIKPGRFTSYLRTRIRPEG